ncbi:hypothetical protein [Halosimplex pelagicum]|uniref:Uncharacterized protein n=1 Tax=Halosimplex pelagicum TaxID=869886 RepID=A0A7D5T349_9EURY|nr:hypothetical protein [Halosimplex pelagicum]QLH81711.1 hypothetical protein HZS54_08765 [Halosimplex pelagicum]
MNRRQVLAGLGSALSVTAAGCPSGPLGSRSDGPAGEPATDLPETPGEYPMGTGDLDAFDPTETYRTVEVGSREGVPEAFRPHDVAVWNAASHDETVVDIHDYATETRPLDRSFAIPDDAAVRVSLLEPSPYLVTVGVPDAGAEQTLKVPCRFFDCNSSATQVGLFDGEIRSTVWSTLAGCRSPTCLPEVELSIRG